MLAETAVEEIRTVARAVFEINSHEHAIALYPIDLALPPRAYGLDARDASVFEIPISPA